MALHELVIDAILKAHPKRVIHIEPMGEVLNLFRLLDLNYIVYSLAIDYPDNLLTNLQQREQSGTLRTILRNPSGPRLRCATHLC